jgi:hypothetical protein
MLGSDHDGEVLSAVSAIRRALEAGGATFADLAEFVQGGGNPKRDLGDSEWAEVCEALREKASHLKSKEREFVFDMCDRINRYGRNTFVSAAQGNWLRSLYSRYV